MKTGQPIQTEDVNKVLENAKVVDVDAYRTKADNYSTLTGKDEDPNFIVYTKGNKTIDKVNSLEVGERVIDKNGKAYVVVQKGLHKFLEDPDNPGKLYDLTKDGIIPEIQLLDENGKPIDVTYLKSDDFNSVNEEHINVERNSKTDTAILNGLFSSVSVHLIFISWSSSLTSSK